MALIQCPECSKSVSSIAAACPHCGAPVSGVGEAHSAGTPLTTIQQTSKKLKVRTAVGGIISLIGFAWLLFNFYYRTHNEAYREQSDFQAMIRGPAVVIGIGLLWSIVMRIRIWWHHG